MSTPVPAVEADIEGIVALRSATIGLGWSAPWLRRQLRRPHNRWWVVHGGASPAHVVGFLYASGCAGEWELCDVAVAPGSRRRGLGRGLVRALCDALQPGERLVLEVREHNRPARALYRGFGFQQVGRRVGYYRDPTEDALVLALERPLIDTTGPDH